MSKMSKAIAALGVVAGLGVAALPLSSYAAVVNSDPLDVTAQAIIEESISVTADATDDTVKIENVTANQEVASNSTTLTVETNNTSGYSVSIKDKDAVTALTTDGTDAANGIPAATEAALIKGNKGWGFKTSTTTEGVTVPTAGQSYRAIETGPQTIASRASGASVADGDKIELTFGVVVDASIAAGTYEDVVTITATTNS